MYKIIDHATGKQWTGDKRHYKTQPEANKAIHERLKQAYAEHEIINNLVFLQEIKRKRRRTNAKT